MRTDAEIAHDEYQINNASIKLAPAPAGTRQQRRAAAARKVKALPKSIWLITHVGVGQHVETATPMYRIAIEKRHQRDVMFVFSREGAAPVQGGLLERTALPNGGEAAIWTDARAAKEGMGGGYTRAAVPKEWSFLAAPVVAAEPRAFQNLNLGEPWPGSEFRSMPFFELGRDADGKEGGR